MRPSLTLLIPILFAAACAPRAYKSTRTVDARAFKKVQTLCFMRGNTPYPKIEDEMLTQLSQRYANVTKEGSVIPFLDAAAKIGALEMPAPDPAAVAARAGRFGDCGAAAARRVRETLNADAFYVLWVTDWTGGPVRPRRTDDDPDGGTHEMSPIHRQVVAEICDSRSGRELWHSVMESRRYQAQVRTVSYEAFLGAREQEIQEVINSLWNAFWL